MAENENDVPVIAKTWSAARVEGRSILSSKSNLDILQCFGFQETLQADNQSQAGLHQEEVFKPCIALEWRESSHADTEAAEYVFTRNRNSTNFLKIGMNPYFVPSQNGDYRTGRGQDLRPGRRSRFEHKFLMEGTG